jgi:hypothetical protein
LPGYFSDPFGQIALPFGYTSGTYPSGIVAKATLYRGFAYRPRLIPLSIPSRQSKRRTFSGASSRAASNSSSGGNGPFIPWFYPGSPGVFNINSSPMVFVQKVTADWLSTRPAE